MLPNDVKRCSGGDCPMKERCRRYLEIPDSSVCFPWYAVKMWRQTKRGPKCDHLIESISEAKRLAALIEEGE